ncbi:MAG: ATP-binding protein [Streptosporangiales bacterium]|nr:ATP-binding protein [Streptosporangiales bacterium]
MDIRFSLVLPREALSVPVIRQVLGDALRTLGADEEGVTDILVAISEACTNVVDHAAHTDSYEVVVCINDRQCLVTVLDSGNGFDPAVLGPLPDRLDDETGRGIELMRALVDDVAFEDGAEGGTVVHLHKKLGWRGDPPLAHAS